MFYLRNTINNLFGLIQPFSNDRRGNIAIMFAMLIIPIIGLVGAAIDFSIANRTKTQMQNALDATSLAVNQSIGRMNNKSLHKLAKSTFAANLGPGQSAAISSVDISTTGRQVSLKATTSVKTVIMGMLGIDAITVTVESTSVAGGQTLEIGLVLDNSGSMRGRRLADLKKAAKALTAALLGGNTQSDTIKIGVVPFAAAVNVGPQHRTSAWIDVTGKSPIHAENLSKPFSRFALYDNIRNDSWKGCVETRPYPLDVQDTAPSARQKESYFVPMFAPDEPDGQKNTLNNYLSDQLAKNPGKGKGKGRGKGKGKTQKGGKGGNGADKWDWDTAQMNIDKYFKGVTAKHGLSQSSYTGPNMMCDSTPVTPLTKVLIEVRRALVKMRAFGMTNIHEGVMWGWRILSPGAPFTEGVSRDDENNRKIMVLMSDGANTHRGINSPNMSMYSAYGLARNGRLGPPTRNTSTLVKRMNQRTREACTNAKKDGILIYTIAFDLRNQTTRNLLRECASSKGMAFTPDNGGELIAVFQDIAGELSNLRIAK